jgi:hypothetical protein
MRSSPDDTAGRESFAMIRSWHLADVGVLAYVRFADIKEAEQYFQKVAEAAISPLSLRSLLFLRQRTLG